MEYFWKRKKAKPNIWKGMAAGLIGGLVASWTMNKFQSAWAKAAEATSDSKSKKSSAERQSQEDPTMKTADMIVHALGGRHLTKEQKQKAGLVVHYAFGAAMGGVYGAVAEARPEVKSGAGIPYGAALFVGADEVALPALGLSKKPNEYPLSTHIYALASHCVYGVTAEMVRRTVRSAL